ncbi:MAG TPA: DUF58 domain-containing protein [Steroidobacteraceae bacterium]|jgi:uncharacterized protein (DUF58 family)|nr:DUF58 domain-containing protein [Steroidobacteraceae bacterium]
MSLRINSLLLVLFTAAIAVLGDWSAHPLLAGLWLLPAALLLLGLAYESWSASRAGLTFDIEPPERLYLGRGSRMDFIVTHRQHRKLVMELAPSAPEFFDIEGGNVILRIAAGERIALPRRVCPTRLGVYDWPTVRARIAGPLRLAWWSRELACRRRVRVLPDLFHSEAEVKGISAAGAKSGTELGTGAEVLRLREYRTGDPPRIIDWKATARAGRLISRDFAQDHRLEIVILVDAGRASALRAGDLDRFGHYVNVAARLAQYAAGQEDLVGLVVYADRPLAVLAPARGAPAVARLRATLAGARVERTESNPLYAAVRVRTLVRQRSLVVLLTDVDDTTVASQLAQAVRLLLPKHLPFVAGLSSGAAESMASSPANHWLDPYRSLAAQEYCKGLERKVRALNALGAPALVAKPDQLEHAVFAAYANFRRSRRA